MFLMQIRWAQTFAHISLQALGREFSSRDLTVNVDTHIHFVSVHEN